MNVRRVNRERYDEYWRSYKVQPPETWSQWMVIKDLIGGRCLEIGPGTKPKIPVKGNYFLDISKEAVKQLRRLGGKANVCDLTKKLPFKNENFDLICAFEVLEHLTNDDFVLREMHRILKDKGRLVVSFPLNMGYWNEYDQKVGHVKRYEPGELKDWFKRGGFRISRYAAMEIPWPGKVMGAVLSGLPKRCQPLIVRTQKAMDMRPSSGVRRRLDFTKWKRGSEAMLAKATTGLFVLVK